MENKLSTEESLKIIHEMIAQAKTNYEKRGSFYFLLWGWVVVTANLGHYLLERFTTYEYPYAVWLLTLPAIAASIWHAAQQKKKALAISHLSHLYGQVWIAVGIGMVLSLLFMSRINFNHTAVILMLAGIGTFMSGQMLRFRPLVIGALALWTAAFICFNMAATDQHLIAALGITAGYLVPGYLLKSSEQ